MLRYDCIHPLAKPGRHSGAGFLLIFILLFALRTPVSADALSTPVRLGIDTDLSAVAVEGGIAITRGVELAVEKINANGGVLGRPLKLEIRDHRGNPARGMHHIQELAEMEDMAAIIGGVHTPVALASLPAIHKHNVIYLDPWAAGTAIVDNGYRPNNVFRISVRDSEAGKVMVKHIAERGFKRITLVLERTAWGRSNEQSISAAAKSANIDIVATHWINWQQPTFDDAKAVLSDSSDAVVIVANSPEGATVINSLFRSGHKLKPVVSHWGIASGSFVERLDADVLSKMDIHVLQTFSFQHQDSPESKALLHAYYQKYGETAPEAIPAVVGLAHAYDLTMILAKAIASAQSLETDAIREALESLEEHQGVVKNYVPPFTENRHDALWADDYFMARYNKRGILVPEAK